jgi:EpsD family peptidyl-prolyl cis-trans isomerase
VKSHTLLIALAAGACLTTTGCDKVKSLIGGKPSGQVVATVDGQEITSLELKTELGGFSSSDPKVTKAAEQQALQSIILRRLVAAEARKQKMDKAAEYTIQVRRGAELLLAQTYERKITQGLTPPTVREGTAYVDAHPNQFANRRLLSLEQIIAPADKIDPKKLRALNTFEDIKHQFTLDNTPFQEQSGQLDTLTAPPGLVAQIAQLKPGEPFVVPQRGLYVFSRVTGEKSAPFQGDAAANYATRLLAQQQVQGVVSTRLQALRKAAEAKIVYSAAYKPLTPAVIAPPRPGAAPPAK